MGIYDLLGTPVHEKLEADSVRQDNLHEAFFNDGLAVRKGPKILCHISSQPLL